MLFRDLPVYFNSRKRCTAKIAYSQPVKQFVRQPATGTSSLPSPDLSPTVPATEVHNNDDTPVQPITNVIEPEPNSATPTELRSEGSVEQKSVYASSPLMSSADADDDVASPQTVANPYGDLLGVMNELKAAGPYRIEQEGDRITTLQISSAAFFNSGSADLNNSGRSILKQVGVKISSDKYKGYQVTVEGHTDDSPIRTRRFPSNWELSTARAAAVVHFLLQQGIPAQKLRAAGYADTFPVVPNRGANGKAIPANQARNRRVVIKLEKIDKAE